MEIETKGRGAPLGNQNAARQRLFYDKLRKILIQEPHRLHSIAEKLISEAENGESWAIKEIIDRVDGKALQALENADGTPLLSGIVVSFVKPE